MSNFAFEGPKWQNTTITWAFAAFNYPSDDPFTSPVNNLYQLDIQRAFARWSISSGLSFQQVSDSSNAFSAPDIRIGFDSLRTVTTHVVGLTRYFGSQFFRNDVTIRFEDPSELPILNQSGTLVYSGFVTTLYQDALHEIGHALGLDHSTDPASIMYPILTDTNRDLDASDVTGIGELYHLSLPQVPQSTKSGGSFEIVDTSTGSHSNITGQVYTGPVAGLQNQFIRITSDNLNVAPLQPNNFIHTGSGTDAIDVRAFNGRNVLDGGTGSNFLAGGSGTDTFFVDDRGSIADIWSTVVGFHAGDSATIWGVRPQDFGIQWADGQGASGFTGLTLHATAAGRPTASLTLSGYSQSDLKNGRLSVLFGSDQASGSSYALISADK